MNRHYANKRDGSDPHSKRRRIHGNNTPYRGRNSSSAQYSRMGGTNDRHILQQPWNNGIQQRWCPPQQGHDQMQPHSRYGQQQSWNNQMQQQPRHHFGPPPPLHGHYGRRQPWNNQMQPQDPSSYGRYGQQQPRNNQIQPQDPSSYGHFDQQQPHHYDPRHYGGRNGNHISYEQIHGGHGQIHTLPSYSNDQRGNAIQTTQNFRIDFASAQSKDDAFRMLYENKHAWNPRLIAAAWLFFSKSLEKEMDLRFIMQWDHQFSELLRATRDMMDSFKKVPFKNVFKSLAEISAALKEERAVNALGLNGTTFCKQLLDERWIFSSFANNAVRMMPQFDRRLISGIVGAYCMSGRPQLHDGRDLLAVLGDHVVNRKVAFFHSSAEGCSFAFYLTYKYAIYRFKHPKMFECIANFIVSLDHLHYFEQQHIPKISWAYTKNRHSHPSLRRSQAQDYQAYQWAF